MFQLLQDQIRFHFRYCYVAPRENSRKATMGFAEKQT